MEPDLLAELGTCQHTCAESPPINAGKPQHLNPTKLPGYSQEYSSNSTQGQAAATDLPVVTTRLVPQSSHCGRQRDRTAQEVDRTNKAPGTVSAAIPLSGDSPQEQSRHPGAAIAPSAD